MILKLYLINIWFLLPTCLIFIWQMHGKHSDTSCIYLYTYTYVTFTNVETLVQVSVKKDCFSFLSASLTFFWRQGIWNNPPSQSGNGKETNRIKGNIVVIVTLGFGLWLTILSRRIPFPNASCLRTSMSGRPHSGFLCPSIAHVSLHSFSARLYQTLLLSRCKQFPSQDKHILTFFEALHPNFHYSLVWWCHW